MTTITTMSVQTETAEATETARQLTRVRRQRDVLIGVVCGILALGVLLVVRLAPSWADPVDAGLTACGVCAAVVVPYLLRRHR